MSHGECSSTSTTDGSHANVRPQTLQLLRSNDPALTEIWEEGTDTPRSQLETTREKKRPKYKEIIRHFSPSWFCVTMGTGVVATLLNRLPYNGSWLYYLSIVVFVLNAVLFCVALILSVIRYWMWPRIWTIMSRDRHHSLFLGALPIGFTTLINMLLYVCVPAWGTWVATLAWVLWIIDSIVALFVTFLVPYITMTHGERSALHTVNAVQLLPLSSTLSSASTGSLVAGALPNPEHALWTMIASYALLGVGLPLVMTVLAIYYQRLTLHHLPPREVIVSVFLPVSPLCLASFSLLRLGSVAAQTIPRNPTTLKYASAGETLHTFGCITAVILWAHSLVWLAYAVASIAHQRHFPFNMGWWSFTFPLGMLALDTIAIGTELGSAFFRVLGTIIAVTTILLWIVVVVGTIRSAVAGRLLYTSSVSAAELAKRQRSHHQDV